MTNTKAKRRHPKLEIREGQILEDGVAVSITPIGKQPRFIDLLTPEDALRRLQQGLPMGPLVTPVLLPSREQLRAALASQKGGRAPKRKPKIWQRVLELVKSKPKITVGEAWNSFPRGEGQRDECLIYHDGNNLVEVDDRTGRVSSITYQTFRDYLKAARRKLQTG